MKIRTLFGLALIGGALYAHRRHGGEWTIESFKDSVNDLMDAITRGTREAADRARETAERARRATEHAADRVQAGAERANERVSDVTEQFGSNGNGR